MSDDARKLLSGMLKALRVHQWAKNVILFLPLIAAHKVFERGLLAESLIAFYCFCCCASGMYVLNDLLDLASDRQHAEKKLRPFASGAVPIRTGIVMMTVLLGLAFSASFLLPRAFLAVLALYATMTVAYSFRLKRIVLVDVFLLAALYTIRLIAGHAATRIVYSVWLLGFSMFLFLSLALVKRVSEIIATRKHAPHHVGVAGRGYRTEDLEILEGMGMVSGGLAVLVLAVYIGSPDVGKLYRTPLLLLLLCPLAFYWIGRIWLITHRGWMKVDPVVFALRDRVSYYVLGSTGLILFAATRDWSWLTI